jgi:hypothetical protein
MEPVVPFVKNLCSHWADLALTALRHPQILHDKPLRVQKQYESIVKRMFGEFQSIDSVVYGLEEACDLTDSYPNVPLPPAMIEALDMLKADPLFWMSMSSAWFSRFHCSDEQRLFQCREQVELLLSFHENFIVNHTGIPGCIRDIPQGPQKISKVLAYLSASLLNSADFIDALHCLTKPDGMVIESKHVEAVSRQLQMQRLHRVAMKPEVSIALTQFYKQSTLDEAALGMLNVLLDTDESEQCTYDERIACEEQFIAWLEDREIFSSEFSTIHKNFSDQVVFFVLELAYAGPYECETAEYLLHRFSQRRPERFPTAEQRAALEFMQEQFYSEP